MSCSPLLPRLLLAALLVSAVVAVAAAIVAVVGAESPTEPAAGPSTVVGSVADRHDSTGPGGSRAREALRIWDGRRSRAWARGDVEELRALYVAGSSAGRRDVAMLRRWTDRGLRVDGLQTQVLALRVVRDEPGRLVLRVTDRLAAAVAVGPQGTLALPRDRTSTWRIDLRLTRGAEWRMASLERAPR